MMRNTEKNILPAAFFSSLFLHDSTSVFSFVFRVLLLFDVFTSFQLFPK